MYSTTGIGAAWDTAGAPTELFPEQEVDSIPQPVKSKLEASDAALVLVSDATITPWPRRSGDIVAHGQCPNESFDLQASELRLKYHSSPIALLSAPAL